MTADGPGLQQLTDLLARIRAAWPGTAWEWDDRMGCALATATKAQEAAARETLTAGLPAQFTAGTLAKASPLLQKICANVGGLRGNQLVFAADLPGGIVAYCLWWPWGGNTTFSARVGAAGAELTKQVRAAFGLK